VTREDARLRDQYGRSNIGSSYCWRGGCASRVGFVTIHYAAGTCTATSPGHAQPGQTSTRRSDIRGRLRRRGLDQEILLSSPVSLGVRRASTPARPRPLGALSTLALSGGGLRMGQVVGESSNKAEVPRTTPITAGFDGDGVHVLGCRRI